MYPKKEFFTNVVWNTNSNSHQADKNFPKKRFKQFQMFVGLLSVPIIISVLITNLFLIINFPSL